MRALTAERITSAGRRGSSRPIVVDTAAGPHLVKLRGAAQGTGPLAAEIIVGALADAAGLAVPPRALVDLPAGIPVAGWDDELADLLAASTGLNLGFAYLEDARDLAADETAALDPDFQAAVLWLDRLVLNPDRTARNPNILWCRERPWLIDHGAALGVQYGGLRRDASPRQPWLMPTQHLFERGMPAGVLAAADTRLAPLLSPPVLDAAALAVPDDFLLCPRAEYSGFLAARLEAPRPFLDMREPPVERPRGEPPAWLRRKR